MSFHNAPLTKAMMLGLGINSLMGGTFQYKHVFKLQLVPHITKYRQWWRILAYQAGFSSSSDLFISQILFFNASVALERIYGSRKFGSFVFVSGALSTTLAVLSLMASAWFGVNTSFHGPVALIFSILYAYSRAVPSAYRYRIFGLTLTDKTPHYFLAGLLALNNAPESLVLAVIGLMTGAACRSDILPFKSYRLPRWVNKIASMFRPLIGSTDSGYRTYATLPELGLERENETTNTNPTVEGVGLPESADVGNGGNVAPRQPTQEEIAQLTAMFPNATRVQIVNAISSTPSLEAAVERLIQ